MTVDRVQTPIDLFQPRRYDRATDPGRKSSRPVIVDGKNNDTRLSTAQSVREWKMRILRMDLGPVLKENTKRFWKRLQPFAKRRESSANYGWKKMEFDGLPAFSGGDSTKTEINDHCQAVE